MFHVLITGAMPEQDTRCPHSVAKGRTGDGVPKNRPAAGEILGLTPGPSTDGFWSSRRMVIVVSTRITMIRMLGSYLEL